VLRWNYDFEQFAVVRPTHHCVSNTRRLEPAGACLKPLHTDAFEVGLEPALEAVHQLELYTVVVAKAQLGTKWCRHPDHVRFREATRRLCDSEISVSGVVSQPSRLEIAFIEVTDRESLCSRFHHEFPVQQLRGRQ
jgi:hypothetical protein